MQDINKSSCFTVNCIKHYTRCRITPNGTTVFNAQVNETLIELQQIKRSKELFESENDVHFLKHFLAVGKVRSFQGKLKVIGIPGML